jgi:hypothetical protein
VPETLVEQSKTRNEHGSGTQIACGVLLEDSMTQWELVFSPFFNEISQIINNSIFNLYKASIAEENDLDRLPPAE